MALLVAPVALGSELRASVFPVAYSPAAFADRCSIGGLGAAMLRCQGMVAILTEPMAFMAPMAFIAASAAIWCMERHFRGLL